MWLRQAAGVRLRQRGVGPEHRLVPHQQAGFQKLPAAVFAGRLQVQGKGALKAQVEGAVPAGVVKPNRQLADAVAFLIKQAVQRGIVEAGKLPHQAVGVGLGANIAPQRLVGGAAQRDGGLFPRDKAGAQQRLQKRRVCDYLRPAAQAVHRRGAVFAGGGGFQQGQRVGGAVHPAGAVGLDGLVLGGHAAGGQVVQQHKAVQARMVQHRLLKAAAVHKGIDHGFVVLLGMRGRTRGRTWEKGPLYSVVE